jgi:L-lactate dehydrogenase (cytochrome)
MSTLSTQTIEEVRAVSDGRLWFQVYVWRDRPLVKEMIGRAAAAGYEALVLTVDTPVNGRRERDVRRGFTLPPAVGLGTLADGALHPGWTWDFLQAEPIRFANLTGNTAAVGDGSSPVALSDFVNTQYDPALSWADLDWLRDQWNGPVIVKGIATAADAVLAVEHGASAVVISNHGGRQLDGVAGTFSLLPAIADAVGGRAEVICDGGVRRGSDIVKAVAAGATAAMAGRAYLYGLGAAGERGVDRVLGWLRDDVIRTMTLLGARTPGELDRSLLGGLDTGTAD